MSKVYRFPRPNGDVLVVTQNPDDPTRSTTHFEDANGIIIPGRNVVTEIEDAFANGQISKK